MDKQTMRKLVFKVPSDRLPENRNRLRMTPDAMALVRGVQRQTGFTLTEITSRMIEFAAQDISFEADDAETEQTAITAGDLLGYIARKGIAPDQAIDILEAAISESKEA